MNKIEFFSLFKDNMIKKKKKFTTFLILRQWNLIQLILAVNGLALHESVSSVDRAPAQCFGGS